MKFQYELQRLRREQGLSQDELGERLGVSRQTVSKWENGTSYPDMLNLMAISSFFSVSVDSLISEVPESPYGQASPGDLRPAERERFHYEYKSKRTLFGLPLIHVNFGCGLYQAKGIVAIGMISKGLISIGVIALGLVSFGALAVGALVLAGLSAGLFAVGGVAVGAVAVGGIAAGVFTLGGVAVGAASIGGVAVGSHVAVGGWCSAPVAVGVVPSGTETIHVPNPDDIFYVAKTQVYHVIYRVFPDIWRPIADWAVMFFR